MIAAGGLRAARYFYACSVDRVGQGIGDRPVAVSPWQVICVSGSCCGGSPIFLCAVAALRHGKAALRPLHLRSLAYLFSFVLPYKRKNKGKMKV